MTKNGVIIFGIISAVLSQYIWLVPLAYGVLVCSVVAEICALVASIWQAIDYMKIIR